MLRRSGRSLMGRPGCLASRNRGPPRENPSDGGTHERYQEDRHETGDDAQPLRPAKSAASFRGSLRRIRSGARTPAHSESPFHLVKGGGIALRSQLKRLNVRGTVLLCCSALRAYCCSGLGFSRYPGRGQIWTRRRQISRARVPPHYRKRQCRLSRFPAAGPAGSRKALESGRPSRAYPLVSGLRSDQARPLTVMRLTPPVYLLRQISGCRDQGLRPVCNCKHHGARLTP
jgi:hypothetical protein